MPVQSLFGNQVAEVDGYSLVSYSSRVQRYLRKIVHYFCILAIRLRSGSGHQSERSRDPFQSQSMEKIHYSVLNCQEEASALFYYG